MKPDRSKKRAATLADFRELGRDHARQLMQQIRAAHQRGELIAGTALTATLETERARLAGLGCSEAEIDAWAISLERLFGNLSDAYCRRLEERTAAREAITALLRLLALAAAAPAG